MSFQISDVYRDNIPRGIEKYTDSEVWDNSSQTSLTLTTTTDKAIRVGELLFIDASSSITYAGATPKCLTITYPSADGEDTVTINVDSIDELKNMVTATFVDGSTTYWIIQFKAPIWLKDSQTNKTITITFTGTSFDSGSLTMRLRAWEIDEADY